MKDIYEARLMKFYRRFLKIPWTEQVSNSGVLKTMETQNHLISEGDSGSGKGT